MFIPELNSRILISLCLVVKYAYIDLEERKIHPILCFMLETQKQHVYHYNERQDMNESNWSLSNNNIHYTVLEKQTWHC